MNHVDEALLNQGMDSKPVAHWGGVFAMSLCAFAMVASEFLPVSLLTLMSDDLSVSEGAIGQGISISGLFALITALSISSLAGNLNRRTLMLGLTATMVIASLMVGFAPNYIIYMTGRILVGIALGGFWSLSAKAAMLLVPDYAVPKALAIFNAGNALAMVIAAPLGSYLATFVGWRGAFLCLAPVALITFVWQWFALPDMPANHQKKKLTAIFSHLSDHKILLGFIAITFLFSGQFSLFTYIRPFLEVTAGVNSYTLSGILLLIGIAGFIGTTFINLFLRAKFYLTLALMPLIMAMMAALMILLAKDISLLVVILIIWGLVATAAPVGWWTWISQTMNHDPEAGGGLMVAVVQFAIALGSTSGGLLFDQFGYQTTFFFSAVLLLLGATSAIKLRSLNG